MAIEQDIAELVQASNNLTGVVDGKIQDIDKKVASAESDYQAFKADADDDFQRSLSSAKRVIKVDLKHLDPDKYYAVIFKHPKMFDLRIERYIHADVNGGGILDYYVRLQNWSAGGDFTFAIQEHYFRSVHDFVGKVKAASTPYTSGVWLLGGWSYSLYMSGSISAGPILIEDDAQVVEYANGADYFAPPIDSVDASVVSNGYVRGDA